MTYSHNQTSVSDQLPKGHRLVVAYWTASCLKTQGFSTGNRFETSACLQQKCMQRELNNFIAFKPVVQDLQCFVADLPFLQEAKKILRL